MIPLPQATFNFHCPMLVNDILISQTPLSTTYGLFSIPYSFDARTYLGTKSYWFFLYSVSHVYMSLPLLTLQIA